MERLTRFALPSLLLLGFYYTFFGGHYSVFDLRAAEAERFDRREELARLELENEELRRWADALENDPDVLERIAREEYRMVKPGERVYLFEAGEPSPSDAAPAAGAPGG